MKFSAAVISAFIALVNAIQLTNSNYNVVPGQPFTLAWDGAKGPVTVYLKTGPSGNLSTVKTLVAGSTETSFTLTLNPEDLPKGTYAFEVTDGTSINYSSQFPFEGTGKGTPSDSATSVSVTQTDATTIAPTSSVVAHTSAANTTESTTAPVTTPSLTATRISNTTTTFTSKTLKPSTVTSDKEKSTSEPTTVPDSGAVGIASPIALVFLSVAAMFVLN